AFAAVANASWVATLRCRGERVTAVQVPPVREGPIFRNQRTFFKDLPTGPAPSQGRSSGVRLRPVRGRAGRARGVRTHGRGDRPEVALEELVDLPSNRAENGRKPQAEDRRHREYSSCSDGHPH